MTKQINIRPRAAVKVPASTANLGPGFDTLGMALNLFAWIEMKPSSETQIHLYGDEMNDIPCDKSNLIYKVAQTVFAEAGVAVPELEISMYSDIPLARGLGSSAAAIIGGMVCANALIGNPLSQDRIFTLATALEKHPDNVGASLFGGIVVTVWNGERAEHIRLEPHPALEVLAAIPEFHLETEKARHVLPQSVSMQDAVFNVSHSSLLVAALASGKLPLIRQAMKDKLHQPYRAALVPGMKAILENATEYGALGVALSGAGPTLLALVDGQGVHKVQLEQFLLDTLQREGITAATLRLKPNAEGAVVLPEPAQQSFMELVKGEMGV